MYVYAQQVDLFVIWFHMLGLAHISLHLGAITKLHSQTRHELEASCRLTDRSVVTGGAARRLTGLN